MRPVRVPVAARGARVRHRSGILALVPRLLIGLLVAFGVVAVTWTGAAPARADEGDRVTEFDADYALDPSGTLTVTETINYHFGDTERHGIYRDFITREWYDRLHDVAYDYHIVSVTSPTGAPASYDTTKLTFDTMQELEVRIGDADKYVAGRDQTYKIVYTVRGALRTFSGYDELYWDTLGTGWDASFGKIKITGTVPGGARGLTCYAGPVGSNDGCTSAHISGGKVLITQNELDTSDDLTMGIKINSGLVADNAPHLVLRSGPLIALISGIATVLTLIGSPICGLLFYRSRGRDLRYLDLPPGTVPADGQSTRTGTSGKVEIPVRFSPPDIPVGEAGLLVDGQFQHRDTAATLVDLAVRGAIRLEPRGEHVDVVLLDRDLAHAPHEKAMLAGMFGKKQGRGARRKLGSPGSLTKAEQKTIEAARSQVRQHNWFRRVPSHMTETSLLGRLKLVVGVGGFAVLLGAAVVVQLSSGTAGRILLAVIVPLVPIAIVAWIVGSRVRRRGQRTALGRAVCDQIEGFRTYLATAEADQLTFDEGQDIFSAYLPWAIAFDLTERWTRVCSRLVELGRVPDLAPAWYTGAFNVSAFDAGLITGSVITSATSVASSSSGSGSSGSGFSGGSSFSGGGSSGGGGGGGGGGSW